MASPIMDDVSEAFTVSSAGKGIAGFFRAISN
jgi:hypothetical protein